MAGHDEILREKAGLVCRSLRDKIPRQSCWSSVGLLSTRTMQVFNDPPHSGKTASTIFQR